MVRITNWDRAGIRRTYLNYRDKHPTFSFRIEPMQKSKLDKLAKIDKISTNEFARNIIQMYLSNELVKKTEDLQTEKIKLQIEKLKAEIKYAQIKNNYYETFNHPMSRIAERTIKPQIIEPKQRIVSSMIDRFESHQSPYDAKNKRLQCVDCGCLFCWYDEQQFDSQMQEYQRHLVSKHDRTKTEIERDVLLELKYEGIST
jgi:CRISPR/Cas system CMR-associated protein Cmr5 small subunit